MNEENSNDRIDKFVLLASKLKDESNEGEKFKLLFEIRALVNSILDFIKEEGGSKKILELFFKEYLQEMHVPEDIDLESIELEDEYIRSSLKEFLDNVGMLYESGIMIFINRGGNRIDYCKSSDWPYPESMFKGIQESFDHYAAIGPAFAKKLMQICGKKYDPN